jgi:hypothetical protein
VIRGRLPKASVSNVKKALVVIASLAIIATFWLGAAHTLSAARHDPKPVTRNAAPSTDVLRVQYNEVQVDYEVDMHDGGVWGEQSSVNGG